jgi:hypothetical protein
MAQPFVCDGCNANMADVMLSAIGTGETKALCLYCLYGFSHVSAQALDGGPEMIAAMNAPAPEAAPKAARKPRKPKGAAVAAEAPKADVAADDGQQADPETGEIIVG